ncbi:(d)CMP kinase [Taibaiella koreensis]|uniref:(d)CMP kinase n=1 Tax=Taibaiella koreensis TaxID=1268548 RepID=UPI0021D1EA68|nr:(d)CMP kinase [Taibaiella koreensis]
MKIIIAIDGYSSCGKSTLAKELAEQMHYAYIDTGAMYRAITLYFLRENVSLKNKEEIDTALTNISLHFELNAETRRSEMFLNDENVARNIRDMIVADKVSEVAAIKEVRHFAVEQQQKMGKHKGLVMDGRDIGTVVFPDAELKIFMTADPEIRVKRRFQELYPTNPLITLDEVRHNLEMRDYIDSNREESPLRRADDARLLDNSEMSREEQLKLALQWVAEAKEMKQSIA